MEQLDISNVLKSRILWVHKKKRGERAELINAGLGNARLTGASMENTGDTLPNAEDARGEEEYIDAAAVPANAYPSIHSLTLQ